MKFFFQFIKIFTIVITIVVFLKLDGFKILQKYFFFH